MKKIIQKKNRGTFYQSINLMKKIKNIVWEKEEILDSSRLEDNKHSVHIWNKDDLNSDKMVTLGPGSIEIKENLKIKKDQILNILPETTVLMHPGVSIYSKEEVKLLLMEQKEKLQLNEKNQGESLEVAISINSEGSDGSVLRNLSISINSAIIEKLRHWDVITIGTKI